jgi:predicted HTH transcriptional regulator
MHEFIIQARAKRNFPLQENASPEKLLTNLSLMDDRGRISNSALLLFGKRPQKFFITSEVKCVQFFGNVVEKPLPAYQICRGTLFEMIDQATAFVMDRVDLAVGTRADGKTASVPTDYELPPDAVKEAIVNAVAHRDYTSNGSVQVMLFRNRLEVWNPGQLPYGLTVNKLLEPHKSLPANPLIADPLFWTGYVDKVGTGTEDIVNLCKGKGLKSPEYHQEEDFRVVIWRRGGQAVQNDPEMVQSDPEAVQIDSVLVQSVYDLINENHAISRAALAKALGTSERQVRKAIDALRDKKIRRKGGDSGEWEIIG